MHRTSFPAAAQLEQLRSDLEAAGTAIAKEKRMLLDRVVVGDLRRTTPLVKPPVQPAKLSGIRDSRVFAYGQVVELKDSLTMSDAAYTGAHFGGVIILEWCQKAAEDILAQDKDGCVDWINLLHHIMQDPEKLKYLTDLGNSVRYRVRYDKYLAGVQVFLDSKHGRNPNAPWRQQKPTSSQIYMLRQLGDLIANGNLDFVLSKTATRGDAFDLIAFHGGNPRFGNMPRTPVPIADTPRTRTQLQLEVNE